MKKIVITGGPCAGKTTGLSWIQNAFTSKGYKVIFVSEGATELINSGLNQPIFSTYDFQNALMNMQIFKEKMYEEVIANSNHDKVLLVCDRGTLDGKAFTNDEDYKRILNNINKSELELRDDYDGVFHLVTAAKGAEEFYTLENNTARTETIEEARLLDDKLINIWNGHPHFRIIANEGSFETKMNHLISEISILLGEPKPYTTKKKYLIKYPNIDSLQINQNIKMVELDQTYLKSNNDEKIQVKRRGYNGDYVYYQTNTKTINNQLIQSEKRLTLQEYLEKLNNADPNIKPLHRTRYCITNEDQTFEIDIYPFWHTQAILNVDLYDENQEIKIPEFVKVIKDITNNPEYLNSQLANYNNHI